MNRKQADLINRFAQGLGQAVNTATSAASEGVRQDIPELVRNAARGFAEGSGPLMDKFPTMVGDSVQQGVEGFVRGWKPGLNDLRAGIGPAAQSAWEGAKGLAANRKVQGGAAAALALYGGKKVYDAYQEHKLRRLAGDFMEHEHPGFEGAHDLGALMAANRIGQFSGKTAAWDRGLSPMETALHGGAGLIVGAVQGVRDPVGAWKDVAAWREDRSRNRGAAVPVPAGQAGFGLGAAASQAALLYGAYRGGKALYNHFSPENEAAEAPVKEAMALPLRLGAMGAVAGAGIQGGRAAWNGQSGGDIARAAGKGALVGGALGLGAGAVHGMGHEAGLAAGAEKGMNDLNALRQEHAGRMERVYGAHREELNDFREERQALLNQIRRMQKGASAWDTVKQFAKGHTATNSPLAAGAHAALAKGTMFGGLTAGYTALKGRQEGEGWGDLAQRSAISGVKGSIGGAISTGLGAGAMQHFVNKAHAPGAAATGWMAQARHLHPQAASGPQTFAHMQQAASPKEYMQRMVDVSKGNYPGGASKESPYAFPMT
jgi:hypothetical protein